MDWSILKEVSVGLLGGAIASSIIFLVKWLKKKNIQRKYTLSGYYLTRFQDGQETFTQARVKLKQNGYKLNGVEIHGDGRSWNINGMLIKDSAHIVGSYAASAFYDEGIGSFYLKVEKDQLIGIWTGYANKLREIKSGKYEMTKVSKSEWQKSFVETQL